MKIEKLSNSTYRIRKMYKGKTYTVITDYKPTQKEAVLLMAAELEKHGANKGIGTFESAAKDYISSKDNVLSPSTIREYEGTLKRMDEKFKNKRLSDITQTDIQKYINAYALDHSPKTVSNLNGFITAVLGVYLPNMAFKIKLPQKQDHDDYLPTDEDIQKVIAAAAGTRYEIPFWLAVYGLRRSEICALTIDDLDGNVLTIRKAKVQDKDKKWVVKPYPKNYSSNRKIVLEDSIADLIRKNGCIYNGYPNNIYQALQRYQDRLGIPNFSLHKMRHYFASFAHAKGIPDIYIMEMGGWKTDHVMKTVYRYAFDEKKKESNDIVNEHLKNFLS